MLNKRAMQMLRSAIEETCLRHRDECSLTENLGCPMWDICGEALWHEEDADDPESLDHWLEGTGSFER